MKNKSLLIGDIGGTNARFALAKPDETGFDSAVTLSCSDFETADRAIRHYLRHVNAAEPAVICLAVAGPIVDQRVRFTNNDWSIAVSDLRAEFDAAAVALCNDFEAVAYSIPHLDPADCLPIGLPETGGLPADDFTIGVIGPGTGLGMAGLCKRGTGFFPIIGEGGHVGFAPETRVQLAVIAMLRERFDRVSNERLLSGPGLENIYWSLARIHGDKVASLSAADIGRSAAENSNALASEAVQLFFEILGQVAGNLALILGAFDGIYIAGGIARRYPELLINSRFRSGFESKGRHRSMMERIATRLIQYPEPGLLGASHRARQLMQHRI